MGCDIHLYIEYRNPKNRTKSFSSFGGRINPGRNYYMFGLLSKGVRIDIPEGFEPKGKPNRDELGTSSRSDAYCWITDNPSEDGTECTLEQAENWAKYGNAIIYTEDVPRWVEGPDWHSHSWLSLEEYAKAIELYQASKAGKMYPEPEYLAVLAALKSFAESGFESRIVFWFDN